MSLRTDLPTGTVTFMFTDIEGSTRLVEDLGDEAADLFAAHAELIRGAVVRHRGIEVGTEGDSFFCVFASAPDAISAAVVAQRALVARSWPADHIVRVRMGLHTGAGTLGGDNYFGLDVHRAARVAASGHGGQIVVSESTRLVTTRALPPDIAFRDLGVFRLKGLAEPEHLYDIVADGLPQEFAQLSRSSVADQNFPAPLNPFIGRTVQIEELCELLRVSRLITCTGPGGVGKTRLALEVAARVTDRFEKSCFVPLAPISRPDLVSPTILRSLGISPSGESALDQLITYLADRPVLLVLDNFEQVVGAASSVSDVLQSCPNVRVLVTSRAALRIDGEREYPVPPLSLPPPSRDNDHGSNLESEAARLFVDRARAVRPDLDLTVQTIESIAEITRALDGLPLAIELAAARVRVVSPEDLRYRMSSVLDLLTSGARDVDERQRTLRNTISWSFELLSVSQRRLLEDLSVFRGGAALDAIEATAGLDRGNWTWLDDLDGLVGHSLVNRIESESDSRFALLETIREYAAERLAERSSAADVHVRHLNWYLRLAESAAARLTSIDQGMWLTVLDRERDNLRAALGYAIDAGKAATASRLVLALWRYWHMRGPIPEGLERVARVQDMESLTPADRLRVLEATGGLEWWAGNMAGAAESYAEALQLSRVAGTKPELANALYNAGMALGFNNPGDGTELLIEGLAIGEDIGDVHIASRCRWALASAHQFAHEFEAAHRELTVALSGFEAVGDVFMTNWTLRDLGSVEMVLGRVDTAADYLAAALRFFASVGDVSGTLLLLRDHARIAAMDGDMHRAIRLISAANRHESETGLNLGKFELEALGIENPLIAPAAPTTERLTAEGRAWSIDHAVEYALRET